MCGLPTGGREECFWDCEVEDSEFTNGPIFPAPECLLDCFPEVNTGWQSISDQKYGSTVTSF